MTILRILLQIVKIVIANSREERYFFGTTVLNVNELMRHVLIYVSKLARSTTY